MACFVPSYWELQSFKPKIWIMKYQVGKLGSHFSKSICNFLYFGVYFTCFSVGSHQVDTWCSHVEELKCKCCRLRYSRGIPIRICPVFKTVPRYLLLTIVEGRILDFWSFLMQLHLNLQEPSYCKKKKKSVLCCH